MPDKKITLYAENPVKVGGKRKYQETFEVDSQEQADSLIACGAASVPNVSADDVVSAEEQAAAEKEAAEKSGSTSNVVQLKQAPEDAAERIVAIKTATEKLMREDNPENFTKENGPTVDALEVKLGWTPKAAERNQVWVDLAPAE